MTSYTRMIAILLSVLVFYGCAINVGDNDDEGDAAETQSDGATTDTNETETSEPDAVEEDVPSCAMTLCDDACVDVQTSLEHCGGCNSPCDSVCSGGVCALRVFATSAGYTGDLGGFDGADAKCAQHASDAGLSGTWMAWLGSDAGNSPQNRFLRRFNGPYVTAVNHVPIADDWDDLVDGVLDNPIDTDELGNAPPRYEVCSVSGAVWTGTTSSGEGQSGRQCADANERDWSSGVSVFGELGTVGDFDASNDDWTAGAGCTGNCGLQAVLYCFEQ